LLGLLALFGWIGGQPIAPTPAISLQAILASSNGAGADQPSPGEHATGNSGRKLRDPS
jgi:hypothetical protein